MKKILLLLFLISVSFLNAETHTVTTSADDGDGSLRKIIADAKAGDSIIFASNISEINLTGRDVIIDKDLTIIGNAHSKTTINAGIRRIFYLEGNYNFNISNLILTGVTRELDPPDWRTYGSGGALYLIYGSCTATNCEFTKNNILYGPAVCVSSGFFIAINCVFSDNLAGLFIPGSDFRIGGSGGAIYSSGSCIVINCIFSNNTTLGGGGGAIFTWGSNCIIVNCVFSNNTTTNYGGVIDGGHFIAINSIFTGNTAHRGGVIASNTSYLYHCTFDSNDAKNSGGAIVINATTGMPQYFEMFGYNNIFTSNTVAGTLDHITVNRPYGVNETIIPDGGNNLIEDELSITRNKIFGENEYNNGVIMPTKFAKTATRLNAIDIQTPERLEVEKDSIIKWLSTDLIDYKRPDWVYVTYGAVEYNDEAENNFDVIIAPNPAEKDFFIVLYNPQEQKITIDLVDLEGKIILNIFDSICPSGWQTYKVDARLLASASYFVRLKIEDKFFIKKVIVKK